MMIYYVSTELDVNQKFLHLSQDVFRLGALECGGAVGLKDTHVQYHCNDDEQGGEIPTLADQ